MFAEATVERGGHVKHGQDDNAYVRFYKRMEKDKSKDFVEIIFPGDSRTIVDRQVKEDDKHRWGRQWQAYQAGEECKAEGFPLEQWPRISADQGAIRDLNYKHIYTVEQLASVTDQNLPNIGLGARELVAAAKAFIEVKKDTDAVERYAAQYEQIKGENQLLRDEIASLANRLQAMEDAEDKPKRGRPAKELA